MSSEPISQDYSETDLGWIALNMVPGVGPASAHRLAEACGGPERVLAASPEVWAAVPGISAEQVASLGGFSWRERVERELRWCSNIACRVVTLAHAEYPALLRTVAAPPPVLYVRGALLPDDERAMAVVGCRNASHYGLSAARAIAGDLAQAGYTIVSGLALGIDAAAHAAALEAGGRTLAVLGHGLDRVYPPENRGLHDRLIETGAAISEFPLGMPPHKENFPRRNRLISGLALGVLVVEAAKKSGALLTAHWALEQGREVFAVPGQYDSRLSQGTHALIQEGAKLVTGFQDILDEIALTERRAAAAVPALPEIPPDLTSEQAAIVGVLEHEGLPADPLAAACGLPVPRLLAELLCLEMRGLVRAAPGGIYHASRTAGRRALGNQK